MDRLALVGNAPVIVGVLSALSVHDATRAQEQGADAIELRIDLLNEEDRKIEKLKGFVSQLEVPVILTNRRKEEGGSFIGTESERIALLSNILDTVNVDAVDIELLSPSEGKQIVVEKANSLHIPVIFSFHDFNGMPPRSELDEIVTRMYNEGASIAKIAVTPQTFGDALLLLDLTYTLTQAGKVITTIGMGPVGRHLRVVAPLYGSVLTYGYIEGEEAVAPGQFSVRELRSLMELLSVK
ncbi:MAG TPA: type I 3-dehydroquinate dehydratase [Desulfobacteria bacterium]|nr:type I 3-dehydroquinate dehydratase [Desulfobacteria bacterium]